MTHRRQVLRGLVAGTVAGAMAGSSYGRETTPDRNGQNQEDACDCCGRAPDRLKRSFPNVVVHTHHGERARFYSDLLEGKTVLVNLMSIEHHKVYPISGYLAGVYRELGERVGRDVFMYSVTIDPQRDTPAALRAFAQQQGAGPGWLFLTGQVEPLALLRNAFFKHPASHHGHAGHTAHQEGAEHVGQARRTGQHDCSLGVVRYGCETTGTWGTVPAKSPPKWIVERCSWVQPREVPVGPPRRKGPPPMA